MTLVTLHFLVTLNWYFWYFPTTPSPPPWVVVSSFKYPLTQLLGAPRSSTPAWCMTVGPRALLNKNPLAICSKTRFLWVILGCRLSWVRTWGSPHVVGLSITRTNLEHLCYRIPRLQEKSFCESFCLRTASKLLGLSLSLHWSGCGTFQKGKCFMTFPKFLSWCFHEKCWVPRPFFMFWWKNAMLVSLQRLVMTALIQEIAKR